jgi:hypothetical protein
MPFQCDGVEIQYDSDGERQVYACLHPECATLDEAER